MMMIFVDNRSWNSKTMMMMMMDDDDDDDDG